MLRGEASLKMQTPLRAIRAQFETDRDAALSAINEFLKSYPDDFEGRLLKAELCLKAKNEYAYIGETLDSLAPASDAERALLDGVRAQADERAWELINGARARLKAPRFGSSPAADPIADFENAVSLRPANLVLPLAAALALLRLNGGTTPFDDGVLPQLKGPEKPKKDDTLSWLNDDDDDDDDDPPPRPAPPRPSPFGAPPPFGGGNGNPSPAHAAAIDRFLRRVVAGTRAGDKLFEVAVVCLAKRAVASKQVTVDILGWIDSLGEPPMAWKTIRTALDRQTLTLLHDTAAGFLRCGDQASARRIIEASAAAGISDLVMGLLATELLAADDHAGREASFRALVAKFDLRTTPDRVVPVSLSASPLPVPLSAAIGVVSLAQNMSLRCRVCENLIRPNVEQCPFCETRQRTRQLLSDRADLDLSVAPHMLSTAYIGLCQAAQAQGKQDEARAALQQAASLLNKDRRERPLMAELLEMFGMESEATFSPMPPRFGPPGLKLSPPEAALPAEAAEPAPPPAPAVLLMHESAKGITPDLAARVARLNDEAGAYAALKNNQRAALVRRLLASGNIRLARETAAVLFAEAPASQTAQTAQAAIEAAIDARLNEVLALADTLLADDKPEAAIAATTEALGLREDARLRLARAEARIALGHDLPALGDLYSVGDRDRALRQRALKRAMGILEQRWDLDGTRALLAQIDDRAFAARVEARLERRRRGEPVIHTAPAEWQVNDDLLTGGQPSMLMVHAFFAVSLREVGIGGDEQFYRRLNNAQIEFIQVLGAQRDMLSRAVFSLRLISEPHPHVPARGRVQVALLARVSSVDSEAARRLALALWNDLNVMLPMSQENVFVYEPVVAEDELARLLHPFELAQTAEIARRESSVGGVYSVSTFMTGTPDLHNVHWTLMRQAAPAMISIHIMPTSLYAWERPSQEAPADWLNAAASEGPLEGVTPGGATLNNMRRQLAQQQQWQKLNVADQRLTYLQNGFILRIYVAGAEGSSQLLPEMAAATLLAPLQDNGFNGGFQVLRPAKADEVAAVQRNLATLDVERWDPVPDDTRLARLRYLVSEGEAASLFRLPVPHSGGVPGMPALEGKALVPPAGMPANGSRLGVSVARVRGVPVPITQGLDDRRRHSYVVGKTGMGKSTLLQTLILQDIEAGRGVFLLDPHGDLCDDVLARVPAHRANDVILFDPSDDQFPIGLNILRAETDDDRDRVVSDFIGLLIRMYDPHNYAIVGPIFQQTVRNAMLAAMCLPDGTLVDVYRMISDQDGSFVKKVLPHITDPIVKNYWDDVAKRMRDASSQWKAEFLPYVLSKFSRFIEDATLRRMIGQKRSGVPFDAVMDEGKILLVNLAKGKIGEQNALFIGSLILSGIMQAAFKRGALPPNRRRDFFMYIDEVQNFATPTLATMLSEGRKFGVVLTIANQYLHQLNAQILEAVFGNIGSILAFRLGIQDVGALGMEFHPAYAPQELSGLPQFTAAVKLLIDGVAARPFTMRTLPSMVPPNMAGAEAIRAASQARYGTPIAEVEAEIGKRFTP